jgi:hypothetical protein
MRCLSHRLRKWANWFMLNNYRVVVINYTSESDIYDIFEDVEPHM